MELENSLPYPHELATGPPYMNPVHARLILKEPILKRLRYYAKSIQNH
jgi:hypothetical protein